MELESIRKDFPVLEEVVYLDNAATTQTPKPVVEEMISFFYEYGANYGRGAHILARKTTEAVETARETLAKFLGASPEQIVFTKNTTEALNLVANGLEFKKGDHVITTQLEHHSNFIPWTSLRRKGIEVSIVEPSTHGMLSVKSFEASIRENTKVVAFTHVSNVFGTIQDVESLVNLAADYGALTVVDGAQSVGHMEVNVKKLKCDFMAISGHKGLLGPQGTGALYVSDPEILEPSIFGGGAVKSVTVNKVVFEDPPYCFEPGTPNIPGVIGLGKAIEYVKSIGVKKIEKWERELGDRIRKGLQEIEGVTVYGSGTTGVVPFNIRGIHPHDVAIILDEVFNICVRSGHHCAMPLFKILKTEGSVRASVAVYNSKYEVDQLIEGVENIASNMG